MSISYRKRENTPNDNHKNQLKTENVSGKLSLNLYRSPCVVIIYEEKYFTFSGRIMSANAGYCTIDKRKCSDNIRFAGKEKFPSKVLVMIVISISAPAMSKTLISRSKSEAINFQIYVNKCLGAIHSGASPRPRLNVLVRFSEFSLLVDWMDKNINNVAKRLNPPNVQQVRSTENF